MPDTLYRLAIHVTTPVATQNDRAVDLILPADCPVAVLMPSIVDITRGSAVAATDPHHWHLHRIGGERLDASMTLRENGIHDGELIMLGAGVVPTRPRRPSDAGRAVAGVVDRTPTAALRAAVPAACLAVTLGSAAMLAWSGSTGETSAHLWTAGLLAAGAAAGAVVIARTPGQLPVVLSLAAVLFATVAGFLAVPGSPWAPALLLAASAGFAVSILMLRMADRATSTLTAVAAMTGTVAAVGAIGVAATPPIEAAAAMLTVVSVGAQSAAPKLTVAVAGIGPARTDVGDRRAGIAHRVLTGLIAGWSAAAVLGVAAVAVAAPAGLTAGFAADVGLLLLLRQRTHVEVRRRLALGASGVTALLVAVALVVSAAPQHAFWLCAAATVVSTFLLQLADRGVSSNPTVHQSFQILEYVALAAVVPLALWVAGVYGLVRDLSLP